MNKEDFNDLVTRLRSSSTPLHLREEVIAILQQQRQMLEDIHMSACQGSIKTSVYLSGTALGKPGYGAPGDMGF